MTTNESEKPKQKSLFSDLDHARLVTLLRGEPMTVLAEGDEMSMTSPLDMILDRLARSEYRRGQAHFLMTEATTALTATVTNTETLRRQIAKLDEHAANRAAEIGMLKLHLANAVSDRDKAKSDLADIHAAATNIVEALPPRKTARLALATMNLKARLRRMTPVPVPF